MLEFTRFVMIFPVLIAEFELRTKLLAAAALGGIERIQGADTMWAVAVGTFINSDFPALLPGIHGMSAIGAEILCFLVFAKPPFKLKQTAADLALKLGTLAAVVVIDINMRRRAKRTSAFCRD